MARDKLITIRIEGEKRQAFGDLAKSQNTDTASLLYDFISGCLGGKIDIKLVTGKGNRLDNQIDSDRLDKLETTTQRLDERLGIISKKLNDWIEAIDDRLTDSDQGLTNRMISLEHRLNALASQLDSQRLDSIDTDSQRIDDMEPLLKREREASIASPIPTIKETSPLPNQDTVEAVDTVETVDEPDTGAIGPVHGDSSNLNNQLSEGVTIDRQGLTNAQLSEKKGIPVRTIQNWANKIQKGKEITSLKYPDFFKQWRLNPTDSLWYEVD